VQPDASLQEGFKKVLGHSSLAMTPRYANLESQASWLFFSYAERILI
jgi:hypothetical protein